MLRRGYEDNASVRACEVNLCRRGAFSGQFLISGILLRYQVCIFRSTEKPKPTTNGKRGGRQKEKKNELGEKTTVAELTTYSILGLIGLESGLGLR